MTQESLSTFSQLLGALNDGELHQDMSEDMREMVAKLHDHAREHGGKPSATMTLTVEMKLDGGLIMVKAEAKTKLPKSERARSVFWATPENNLSRRNPRQPDLPGIRDVTSDTRVRSV